MYFDKVGVFSITNCDDGMHFFDQLLLFIVIKVHVPFGQSCFAGSILDQNEANLNQNKIKLCN